jgi:hypothetical protein
MKSDSNLTEAPQIWRKGAALGKQCGMIVDLICNDRCYDFLHVKSLNTLRTYDKTLEGSSARHVGAGRRKMIPFGNTALWSATPLTELFNDNRIRIQVHIYAARSFDHNLDCLHICTIIQFFLQWPLHQAKTGRHMHSPIQNSKPYGWLPSNLVP